MISPAATSLALTATPAGAPAPYYGTTITYTATATANSPSAGVSPDGTVEFLDNSPSMPFAIPGCTAVSMVTNGAEATATCSSTSPAGINRVVAVYTPTGSPDDASFYPSGSVTDEAVQPEPTGTTLSATLAGDHPFPYGAPVTYTAHVASLTSFTPTVYPDGSVTIDSAGTVLCTAEVMDGVATCTNSALPVGTNGVTAIYTPGTANPLGNANFVGSTSLPVSVSIGAADTFTTLCPGTSVTSCSGSASVVVGASETYVATVAGAPSSAVPVGAVEFIDSGQTVCGSVALNSTGQATCTIPGYPHVRPSPHTIQAIYVPTGTQFTGSRASLSVDVLRDSTTTTLRASTNTAQFGQLVRFTATVKPKPPDAEPPTGTIGLYEGGVLVTRLRLIPNVPAHLSRATTATRSLAATPAPLAALAFTAKYLPAGAPPDFRPSSGITRVSVAVKDRFVHVHYTGTVGLIGTGAIVGSTITGNVRLGPGSAVDVEGSTIHGSIIAQGAGEIRVCGSVISGSVIVANAADIVIVGDPGDARCRANDGVPAGINGKGINGALMLANDHNGVEAINNTVGNLVTSGNSGPGPYPPDGSKIAGNKVL